MARPSVTSERREEILDAFERCVARFGVEGASLQQVADEAGLARGLLRHHVGNKEELIAALVERFVRNDMAETAAFLDALPATGRVEAMIDLLFDPAYASDRTGLMVVEALIAAAQTRPALRATMRRWYDDFEAVAADELRRAHPGSPDAAIREVATGLVSLYVNVDSLASLGPVTDIYTRSKAAAQRLVGTL